MFESRIKTLQCSRDRTQGGSSHDGNSTARSSLGFHELPIQRKASCACGGGCPGCQAKSTLTVSQPNDQAELEADQIADQVMRMREGTIQRTVMTGTYNKEGGEGGRAIVQGKVTGAAPASDRTVSYPFINNLSLGGPLDAGTRSFFEPRFGHDFSAVRIHDDAPAQAAASAIDAKAFTIGNHIAFAREEYDPASDKGMRLIAHELAHTLQQQGPGVIRRHGTHTALTDQGRYEHTLQHAGTDSATWERGYRAATFLGVRISSGIHQELAARLNLAEDHLRTRFPDLGDAEITQTIGLDTISGRRVPGTAVSGSTISNHGYGLAIDVNYRANPFVGRSETVDEIMNRATQFILGREFHISQEQEGTSEDVRARYAEASAALSTYFRYYVDQDFAGLAAAMRREMSRELPEAADWSLGGSPYTSETIDMMERIATDYNNPALRADFATNSGPNRDPVDGFIDLSAALVEAFVDHAGLTWGGQYRTGKDIMHFDWRGGTVRTTHRI